jgi:hypothetical protein
VRGQHHALAAFYPQERPGSHFTGGWVVPRAGLDRCGKSCPTRIRSPDRPVRSQSLYRLSYPVHWSFLPHLICRVWTLNQYGFLSKYHNNLIPVILSAHTAHEDRTDTLFRNVCTYNSDARKSSKRKTTAGNDFSCTDCILWRSEWQMSVFLMWHCTRYTAKLCCSLFWCLSYF